MQIRHRPCHRLAAVTIAAISLIILASAPAAAVTYCVSVNDRTVVCV